MWATLGQSASTDSSSLPPTGNGRSSPKEYRAAYGAGMRMYDTRTAPYGTVSLICTT